MMSRQPKLKIFRIVVESQLEFRGRLLQRQLQNIGLTLFNLPKINDLYFLEGNLSSQDIESIAKTLICDPVTQSYTWTDLTSEIEPAPISDNSKVVEVSLRPGVTDNVAGELIEAVNRLGISGLNSALTGTRYEFDNNYSIEVCHKIAKQFLVNDVVQRYTIGPITPEFMQTSEGATTAEVISITQADDKELEEISQERRLALNLIEMKEIQKYFLSEGREPTDAELETLAQTWSEHCVHKTFKAKINLDNGGEIDGLIKEYLQDVTKEINAPWVRSAFVDNAGVIAFDDEFDISFKVETHNHPSAIEPFGGANTGVGGVVRDILGVSHRPIANTNVLCFGPQDQINEDLPTGVIHPTRIKEGVVHGIEDYGNKLGIPTVNGAILYHQGYTANPLVYCGCVGIGPVDSHPTEPKHGDRVIVLGGRTGRDGIRGATFSSLTMDGQTGEVAGASVQIGDPITEKGVIEVLEIARDTKLYNATTDCGAGGLSSSVGEMAESIGATVDLAQVPLKYPGLLPWEIWLSEAQERIVMAVPPENVQELQEICDTYWVELSDIGEFQSTGRLHVLFGENSIVDIENQFLHHGHPRMELDAVLPKPAEYQHQKSSPETKSNIDESTMLLSLLNHPNIRSKEDVIRRYDHEIRGATVVKPLVGTKHDGPSDAAVMKPTNTKGFKGFAIANGINPFLGEIDPYNMAISAIDEAVRNITAVGADPTQTAILDNFCWGDPKNPETLGSLAEAARGCRDGALHFRTPFISGKDSLNNEYYGNDGKRHAIPGTLLISSIAITEDIRKSITMDLKQAGDILYVVGEWQPALAGSHALMVSPDYFGDTDELHKTPSMSQLAPRVYRKLHEAIQSEHVNAAHDLSEGGLALTAAEMSLAGRFGLDIDLSNLHPNSKLALFAETNGCLLVSIPTKNKFKFEEIFKDLPLHHLGQVTDKPQFKINHNQETIINLPIEKLADAFLNLEESK